MTTTSVTPHIRPALDHYREQQGFTWDETATRCGWTMTELDKVLAHGRGPNINELDTIADALNIQISDVLAAAEDLAASQPVRRLPMATWSAPAWATYSECSGPGISYYRDCTGGGMRLDCDLVEDGTSESLVPRAVVFYSSAAEIEHTDFSVAETRAIVAGETALPVTDEDMVTVLAVFHELLDAYDAV